MNVRGLVPEWQAGAAAMLALATEAGLCLFLQNVLLFSAPHRDQPPRPVNIRLFTVRAGVSKTPPVSPRTPIFDKATMTSPAPQSGPAPAAPLPSTPSPSPAEPHVHAVSKHSPEPPKIVGTSRNLSQSKIPVQGGTPTPPAPTQVEKRSPTMKKAAKSTTGRMLPPRDQHVPFSPASAPRPRFRPAENRVTALADPIDQAAIVRSTPSKSGHDSASPGLFSPHAGAAQAPVEDQVRAYVGKVQSRLRVLNRYPRAARAKQEEGTLVLEFHIDTNGLPQQIQIRQKGCPTLASELQARMSRLRFEPPPSDWNNEAKISLPIKFVLQ